MSFSLNFGSVIGEDIGAAAFHALVAAGWVMFEAIQMNWMVKNVQTGLPPLELREWWVRWAFDLRELDYAHFFN